MRRGRMRRGIYRGCADLDIVILPVGGGGLISGMAAAIKRQRPDITIIGVEPVGADSLSRSFRSGAPEVLDKVDTIADSLGAPMAMAESLALARQYVDELIQIEDSVMARTMLLMRERLTPMAEPACAASLGAALGAARPFAGQKGRGDCLRIQYQHGAF